MAWPEGSIDLTNLDQDTDLASLSRTAIYQMAQWVNDMIASGGARIDAGTKLVFPQAVPPTGWTQVFGLEGSGLRIVDGVGGTPGGSSDAFAPHNHTVNSHNHTLAHTHTINHGHADTFSTAATTITTYYMGSHRHSIIHRNGAGSGGTAIAGTAPSDTTTSYTGYEGSGNPHGHTVNGAVTNVTGNSGGASASNTGSTSTSTGNFAPMYVNSLLCQSQ